MSTAETLEILKQTDFISLKETQQTADMYTLVDLRGRDAYDKGHLEGAVNVPMHRLLDKKNLEEMGSSEQTFVFYGAEISEGTNAWALTRQLGLPNTKALQGNYSTYAEDKELPLVGSPQYDFKAIFEEVGAKERTLDSPPAIVQTPKKRVIPKKKVKPAEEEEGC